MEVRRVPPDLELPAYDRGRRPREVDRVQRVDLPEGDDVGDVAEEANAVHPLTLAEAADAPEADETAGPLAQRRHEALASVWRAAPPHGSSVVATRRTPCHSDMANWSSTYPATVPLAR